jgi:hypothetical protein
VIILFFNHSKVIINSFNINISTFSTNSDIIDVGGLQTFNSSILAVKLLFSILRQEIESLHILSSLDNFLHFLPLDHKHFST